MTTTKRTRVKYRTGRAYNGRHWYTVRLGLVKKGVFRVLKCNAFPKGAELRECHAYIF